MLSRAIMVGFVISQISMMCTSLYLHRGLTHRAVAFSPPTAHAFRVWLWLSTGIDRREWVGVHRRHHAYLDTALDPHSPKLLGWRRVQLANPSLYRLAARDSAMIARFTRDIRLDRMDQLLYSRSLVGLSLGFALVCGFLGWQYAIVAALVHVTSYLYLNAAVNAVSHTFGKRLHPNSATNIGLLALVSFGEGLHNNHHSQPSSPKFGRGRVHLDFGWYTLIVLAAGRLVRLRTIQQTSLDRAC